MTKYYTNACLKRLLLEPVFNQSYLKTECVQHVFHPDTCHFVLYICIMTKFGETPSLSKLAHRTLTQTCRHSDSKSYCRSKACVTYERKYCKMSEKNVSIIKFQKKMCRHVDS